MTPEDSILYAKNSKALKILCAEMERLISVCNYDKKLIRLESYYEDVLMLDKVRMEIDALFDKQLKLLPKIEFTKGGEKVT